MRVTKSTLSQSLKKVFGLSLKETPNRKTNRGRTRRLVLESLENRALFAADFGSAMSFGNDTGNSVAYSIAADSAGNSYMTGYFSGTVDFDQAATHSGDSDILTSRGPQDIFVVKYAPDDSLAWVQRMGGNSASTLSPGGTAIDTGRKITVDGGGNVYAVGSFSGSADFGSTNLVSSGDLDLDGFVVKMNSSGTVQWAKSWGGTVGNIGTGVGFDAAGNVYASASRQGSSTIIGGLDLLKFSPIGAAVWTKFVATGMNGGTDLAVDASGNLVAVGTFSSQNGLVDFDPGPKTYNVSGGSNYFGVATFVLKLNTQGNFGWVDAFQGQTNPSGFSFGSNVAQDMNGNIFVGGSFKGYVDFDPSNGTSVLIGHSTNDGFIVKLNKNGGFVWARSLETDATSLSPVAGLAVDSTGNVYATGSFKGTVDFDPSGSVISQTSAGGYDIFVLKLTADGNFNWVETIGGTGNDVGLGIAVDTMDTIHLAGYFEGTVDFNADPYVTNNLTNPGAYKNGFRLRLRQV